MTKLEKIRKAFAEYRDTEGCVCCESEEEHDAAMRELAELLDIPMRTDGSGYAYELFLDEQPKLGPSR